MAVTAKPGTYPGCLPLARLAGVAGTRERILDALEGQPEPLTVPELAGLTGLHPSTLRSHLPAMLTAGLVWRSSQSGPGAGRPRVRFAAVPPRHEQPGPGQPEPDGERVEDYRMLAAALADALTASPRAGAVSYEAGRRWAEANAEPETSPAVDLHAGAAEVVRLLEEQGLAPRLAANGRDITTNRCPFEELARAHRDIVCQAHIGMVSGAVDELRAPVCVLSLQPLRTEDPLTCRLRLGPA